MSDLQKYIKKRKSRDPKFAENFDSGTETLFSYKDAYKFAPMMQSFD